MRQLLLLCFLLSPATLMADLPSVAGVRFQVRHLSRSVEFFTEVLSFRLLRRSAGEAWLALGDERIQLIETDARCDSLLPQEGRSNDQWFQHIAIVVDNMQIAYAWLEAHHVPHISASPQTLPAWNRAAGGIQAYYFRDPDGHPLELISFPPGKGNPRWQHRSPSHFLGIDHTAIVVKDSEHSITWYQNTLGFRVAGGSENFGAEQEALNHVPGAHLRITTLRGQSGPGVELLQYLEPSDGRTLPSSLCAGDPQRISTILSEGVLRQDFEDPDGHHLTRKQRG